MIRPDPLRKYFLYRGEGGLSNYEIEKKSRVFFGIILLLYGLETHSYTPFKMK